MSKRRAGFLELPSPAKRAKLNPLKVQQGFQWSKDFSLLKHTPDGTPYNEIPLMLPFGFSEFQQDRINPLPVHNWNNMYMHYSSDALHRASLQAISETVQAITIEDRATARFSAYIGHSRAIPFNYNALSKSRQWIAPIPFNEEELSVSKYNSTLYIDYPWIQGAYFPTRYFGIRQSFIMHPDSNPFYIIRRGTKVVLGSVIGDRVTYFVTRIRFKDGGTIGVEVVGVTDDGFFYDDTSLSWPPFMLEVPAGSVNESSFGVWVPSEDK